MRLAQLIARPPCVRLSATAPRPWTVQPCRAASAEASQQPSTSGRPAWDLKLLYDSDCPLCMREVDMLRRRDAAQGRIAFVDIAQPGYSAEANGGVSYRAGMERIHAVLPDGRVVVDVEVFRRAYELVGLGWVYAATRNKTVEGLANKLYGVWAKYRLPITGRPDLETVLSEKRGCGQDGGECQLPPP